MSPSQLSAEGDLVLIFVRVLSLSVSLSKGVYCGLSKAKSVEMLPHSVNDTCIAGSDLCPPPPR